MTTTSEMLAPRISGAAIDMAHRMRMVMAADLDEYDMADRVRVMNEEVNRDPLQFHQAWTVLTSTERAAWKALLQLERPDDNRY